MDAVVSLVVAHPLTEAVVLPVAPLAVAGAAACLVAAAASFGATRESASPPLERTVPGPLSIPALVGRVLGGALLGLAVVAAFAGATAPSRNLAPVLLVAAGFPLLTLLSLGFGPLWRGVDPFDSAARVLRAPTGEGAEAGGSVWPAVLPALLIVGYVLVYPAGVQPRVLGQAVAGYTVLTLAGCLAFGRRWWLERGEPVGLLLTWFGGLRAGRLRGWNPPAGAGALLGVVGGGLVFGLLRGTSLYVSTAFAVGPRAADLGGLVLFAAVGAVIVVVGERVRPGGTVTAAAVPVVAGIVIAHALREARLIFALQLLPGLLVDPLGRGWTLAGVGQTVARPLPFDVAALAMLQLTVLVATGLLAARLVRGRTAGRGRVAAPIGVVLLLVMAGVVGVTTA